MSRFADPKATDRLSLGPCQCPGTPHDEDWIELRTEVGAADLKRLAEGDSLDTLSTLAVSWNLLEDDGTKAPLDREHIDRLFADTFGLVDDWAWGPGKPGERDGTKAHLRLETLPNARAARSPSSSQASGSRRPRLTKVG